MTRDGARPSGRLLAVIALVAVGCYLNAIVRNPVVRELDVRGIAATPSWFVRNGSMDLYRPVTTASFAANYAIHGETHPSATTW